MRPVCLNRRLALLDSDPPLNLLELLLALQCAGYTSPLYTRPTNDVDLDLPLLSHEKLCQEPLHEIAECVEMLR